MPLTDPSQRTSPQAAAEPAYAAETNVSTATAIITSKDDPYLVLVATNEFDPLPVLPGGKIDYADLESDRTPPSLAAVCREVREELDAELISPKPIGIAFDRTRDIRFVPQHVLSGSILSPALGPEVREGDIVKAHYGCPDFLVVGSVDREQFETTEELSRVHFIDSRQLLPGQLSRGHDVIVLLYREMLNKGLSELPEGRLEDFSRERLRLLAEGAPETQDKVK